ncbi:DUF6934 family protein [Spirosoma linguale]|uniref:Uncharacterized protein n=1 Tax=Spirosoma linguale (strain ATCC 33905 / DSM 74 / LMG 10896 / Claus 1) TaxID=504472 RepID=D2QFY0_SPILD|nr:hypothetical protein Slin_5477 [Spirosoma linguale DSM 74]
MNEPAYPFDMSSDALNYRFNSVSKQYTIAKRIQFTPFPDNALLYNLALGDVMPDGNLDDSIVSNNQDLNRVMATVFQAIVSFFDRYPSKLVYFQGSDEAGIRTRLYRVLITRELNKAAELFTIYGCDANNSIEEFILNRDYVGFILQRKTV